MNEQKCIVSVIIPCYNEAGSIAKVIRGFHKSLLIRDIFTFDIIVVDNGSTDRTAEIAIQAGARIVSVPKKGKGNAVRAGFRSIDPKAAYVVMIDGDDTYRPEEVLRLLEPLHNGFCDVVVGSRLGGKIHGDAMSKLNRAGNWSYTHLVRLIYKVNVTDVLSGYFAWKRSVIKKLAPQLHSRGFTIEMEMITKMARMGCEVYSVPISYHQRNGHTHLRPFNDGAHILHMLSKNLNWRHPQTSEETEDEV